MVVAFVFGLGVMGVQFVGLGLTQAKVTHAAQEAAYVGGSSLEAASGRTPCWAVSGGLANAKGYADAAICQTALSNLGDVDADHVSVSVSPASLVGRGTNTPVHVTVTDAEPITSPLLRVFLGNSFVVTSDAWSQ